jgi:hypothetical protein
MAWLELTSRSTERGHSDRDVVSRPTGRGGLWRWTAVFVVVLGVAACGTSSRPLVSPLSPTAVPTPVGTQDAPTPGLAAPTPAVTSATRLAGTPSPMCQLAALRVTEGMSQGTAGSMVTDLDFRNVGTVTCTMEGFPGVSFLDVAGRQIGAPASRSAQLPTRVTLRRDARAASALQVAQAANYPVGDCRPLTAVALRVYPPGSRGSVVIVLQRHTQVCTTASQGPGGQQSHIAPVRTAGT